MYTVEPQGKINSGINRFGGRSRPSNEMNLRYILKNSTFAKPYKLCKLLTMFCKLPYRYD